MRRESEWSTCGRALALVSALALMALSLLAAVPGRAAEAAGDTRPNRYIGAGKCKSCHNAKATGGQYDVWKGMKHAGAWEALASEEALALGARHDVANPQESEQCLKCHVTAFGEPAEKIKKGFEREQGVQCEACHGPGEKHARARFAGGGGGGVGGVREYVAVPEDEIVRAPTVKTCLGCHNEESASWKPFCFYERIAEIRHLNPARPRTAEELAALLVCGCGEECACEHGCEDRECGVAPKEEKEKEKRVDDGRDRRDPSEEASAMARLPRDTPHERTGR